MVIQTNPDHPRASHSVPSLLFGIVIGAASVTILHLLLKLMGVNLTGLFTGEPLAPGPAQEWDVVFVFKIGIASVAILVAAVGIALTIRSRLRQDATDRRIDKLEARSKRALGGSETGDDSEIGMNG